MYNMSRSTIRQSYTFNVIVNWWRQFATLLVTGIVYLNEKNLYGRICIFRKSLCISVASFTLLCMMYKRNEEAGDEDVVGGRYMYWGSHYCRENETGTCTRRLIGSLQAKRIERERRQTESETSQRDSLVIFVHDICRVCLVEEV